MAAGVVAAAGLGAWQVYGTTSGPGPVPAGTLRVGDADYVIVLAEQTSGLSDADLSGMGHGIQGLVSDDSAMIRVEIRVRANKVGTSFDPGDLRVIDDRGGAPIEPAGTTLVDGRLGRGGEIEGTVAFVVPRAGEHLRLGVVGSTATVDLLSVDRAPAGAGAHPHTTVAASSAPSK